MTIFYLAIQLIVMIKNWHYDDDVNDDTYFDIIMNLIHIFKLSWNSDKKYACILLQCV